LQPPIALSDGGEMDLEFRLRKSHRIARKR
jgi:hypothetical protein